MNKQYDVIVIGAGNAGLTAAATTAQNGLKTLLLERHNLPGGAATSFRRGRFEFEPSLHELAEVGEAPGVGNIRQLFESFGADVDWCHENFAFRVVCPGPDGFDVTLPTGVENFIAAMEREVPGCANSVAAVFDLAAKAVKALEYLGQGEPDPQVMATEHADFMRMASHSTQEVLNALGMPKKAQDILVTYWPYLGAPADQLDFLYYALMLVLYVDLKPAMPRLRSHELSLALEKSIRDHGGEIWYNTEVSRILVRDGKAYGVSIGDQEIYAGHIICNSHVHNALTGMMDADAVPAQALKLANARDIALNLFTVYLGMNKSAGEIIENCEKALHIDIKPYIEEIEVAGPPTFARYLNSPKGTPYGYQFDLWDSIITRTMSIPAEETIRGLRFCGACGERGDGYSSAYISGLNTGLRTVNDAKEGK